MKGIAKSVGCKEAEFQFQFIEKHAKTVKQSKSIFEMKSISTKLI